MSLDFCHFSKSYGTRKGGASAVKKIDYALRTGDYSRDKAEVMAVTSGNMPAWAGKDGRAFWTAVDEHERADAVLWRQTIFCLPNECTKKQALELAERVAEKIVRQEHPYTLAVHWGQEKGKKDKQLHVHLVWSDRCHDGIDRTPETYFKKANTSSPEKGGAFKSQECRTKDWLYTARETYCETVNEWGRENGVELHLDPRTYEAQGIDKLATVHEGHGPMAELLAEHNEEIRRINELRDEVEKLDGELAGPEKQHRAEVAAAAEVAEADVGELHG